MKKLLAVLVLVFFASMSYAQWQTNGSNIYYTAGVVGIGTSSPSSAFQLSLQSATKATIYGKSLFTGTGLQTLGGFTFESSYTGNTQFVMSFRHNNTGGGQFEDMLQSVKLSTGAFAEFMYFRFDTQKWEMHSGVKDAEFQNNGNISFNNTGAIGIGMGTTPIPSLTKLAVNGKVTCKEIEVTLTNMPPDYVFDNNYKLRSLYDVENFINSNKHLPDVPSATEMTKGVNVGDMNATLLQKVEELTLYMIQLQKENDALKTRISNLEK